MLFVIFNQQDWQGTVNVGLRCNERLPAGAGDRNIYKHVNGTTEARFTK